MRPSSSRVVGGLAAVILVPVVASALHVAHAAEAATPAPARPLADIDRLAALESVQFALAEVADGSSYVWHRPHGRLSGVVQPTRSYKAVDGAPCRHVRVALSSGTRSARIEGIACRLPTGLWRLDG
jgi:surface antigen